MTYRSARLHEAFGQAMGQRTVIIDLTSATYIDSTVLGCLIRLQRNVAELGGALSVVSPSSNAARLFKVSGLEPMFDIRSTLAEVTGTATFRRVQLVADGDDPAS